jgi:hypothetical protein
VTNSHINLKKEKEKEKKRRRMTDRLSLYKVKKNKDSSARVSP